jgi:antitoxin FitA
MATITIKNIPNVLYQKLKESAHLHRRSINSQVIHCIETVVHSKKIDPDEIIDQINIFYQDKKIPALSEDMLTEYKKAGRK